MTKSQFLSKVSIQNFPFPKPVATPRLKICFPRLLTYVKCSLIQDLNSSLRVHLITITSPVPLSLSLYIYIYNHN